MRGKTRQTVENKHTFDLTGKNEIDEKTHQTAKNKRTLNNLHFMAKIEIEEKIRQNAENKQTLGFDGIFNRQFHEIFTDTYLFLWFLCFYINVCRKVTVLF